MPAARLLCLVPNPSIDRTAEIDRLEPGRIHRPSDVVAVPGGKGLNVARAARSLGLPVEAVLLLAGHAGRWIAAELDRIGLPHRAAWATGETRTCLSVLDRTSGLLTEFYEPGDVVAADAWTAFADLSSAAAIESGAGTLVALSGSLPRGAPDGAAGAIVAGARSAGARVLVDTSGVHLRSALTAGPFLVKVNAAEAAAAVGRTVDSEAGAADAARSLVELGAGRAVVTRGAAGAVGWDGSSAWAVDTGDGGGPYTVGSGDAFLAGFAVGLLREDRFEDCLVRAAAVATASTRLPGPGNVPVADVAAVLRTVSASRLA